MKGEFEFRDINGAQFLNVQCSLDEPGGSKRGGRKPLILVLPEDSTGQNTRVTSLS